MIISQKLGYLVAIGADPLTIKDLAWSLYHFDALYPGQKFKNLRHLGDPTNFNYFFISEEKYIEGRAKCFMFNGQNEETAKTNAINEFNSLTPEHFLHKNSVIDIDVAEIEC